MDAELSNAVGITPACAGKSAAQSLDRLCAGDHPRVCGEKLSRWVYALSSQGSPPRMRGKERLLPEKHTSSVDHPRVCGEKGRQDVK